VHSVDHNVGASPTSPTVPKIGRFQRHIKMESHRGNAVKIPLPLELSVGQGSVVHESAGSHVWEFDNVSKIEVDQPSLFDLPMQITLNNDPWVNETHWNKGLEGPSTNCANHSNKILEVSKVNRGTRK
jgi:hypothetical protein